jgi:hypothetical protein
MPTSVATDVMLAISEMYVEVADHHQAQGWWQQLRVLVKMRGRAEVTESLMEGVEGLTMGQAMTLADLVAQDKGGA